MVLLCALPLVFSGASTTAQDATQEATAPTPDPVVTEVPTEAPTDAATVEATQEQTPTEIIPTLETTPEITDAPTQEVTTAPVEITPDVTIAPTSETTPEATVEVTTEATVEATTETLQAAPSDYAVGQQITTEGYIMAVTGDPLPGSGESVQVITYLNDDSGNTSRLLLDADTAYDLNAERVQVTGQVVGQTGGDSLNGGADSTPVVAVTRIEPVESPANGALIFPPQAFTGDFPWLNLLCSFPDVSPSPNPETSFTPTFFNNALVNVFPGLDHYWRAQSYNILNISGSTTVSGWRDLPRSRSAYYNPSAGANLNLMLSDCLAIFNADNDFSDYYGFNMFFNYDFGGFAYGASGVTTLDGENKLYGFTWMPTFLSTANPPQLFFNHATLAHEMGHAFWLRHTGVRGASGSFAPYTSDWDTMSGAYNCPPRPSDPNYGCVSVELAAFHKEYLDWIADSQIFTANVSPNPQNVVLEQLASPVEGANPLLVEIPIKGSTVKYYTVETRVQTGYDANLPNTDNGVLIHYVDTNLNDRYAQLIDQNNDGNNYANDNSGIWTTGETFFDAANGIKVRVVSANASSFNLEIVNTGAAVAAPAKAVLTGPNTNSFTNDPNITLTWNPVNGALSYEVQLATTANFAPGTLLALNNAVGLTTTNYTLDPLFLTDGSDDAKYYWRVITKNAFDVTSTSAVRNFTFDTISPDIPAPDPTTCGVTFTTLTPTLKWGVSTGGTKYQVKLYVDGNPEETVTNPSITTRSYRPLTPLLATEYRWTVQGIDAAGNESGFAVDCVFTVQSPLNATPIPMIYADDTPDISWTDISWDIGYQVEISNNRTFRASTTAFLYQSGDLAQDTTSFTAPHLWDGVWYLRIRAKRADGRWGGWSPVTTFVVDIP
jgi:M6 family metalloprotease-like protein